MVQRATSHLFSINYSMQMLTKNKASMQQKQEKISNGMQHQMPRELHQELGVVTSLKKDITMQESYLQTNQSFLKLRLSSQESAIRSMLSEAIKFKETLVAFNDGDTQKSNNAYIAQYKEHMNIVERLGNTAIGGALYFCWNIK